MKAKHILLIVILFFCGVSLNAQYQALDFLKAKPHDGDPTIEETTDWLNKNWIEKKNSLLFFDVLRLKESQFHRYSSILNSIWYLKNDFFEYDSFKNTLNFYLTDVPNGAAWGTSHYFFSIFLDNVDPSSLDYNYKQDVISVSSFNNRKLGFYIYQNEHFCDLSKTEIYSFYDLEFFVLGYQSSFNSWEGSKKLFAKQVKLALSHLFTERTSKAKRDGCGACLKYNIKVLTRKNEIKPINQLKCGDTITSYNNINTQSFQTTITGIDSVYHNNLVELHYENDTIICTDDHPFLIENKGWCSLNPEKTMRNYSNYPKVNLLEKGDSFLSSSDNGISTIKLENIKFLTKGEMTYTITGLKKGNTYFANGILTGVEILKNPF